MTVENRWETSVTIWNTTLRNEEILLAPTQKSRWRTLSGGQFNWGGCLQKRNGGVQRLANPEWKPGRVVQSRQASLTARRTGRADAKAGVSDPRYPRGRVRA